MTITYIPDGSPMSEQELQELREASKRPVIVDEDCPEVTVEVFKEALKKGNVRRGGKKLKLKSSAE